MFLKQAIHARIHMSFFLILKPFVPGISLQDSPVVRTDKHFRTDNSFVVIYKHSTSDTITRLHLKFYFIPYSLSHTVSVRTLPLMSHVE